MTCVVFQFAHLTHTVVLVTHTVLYTVGLSAFRCHKKNSSTLSFTCSFVLLLLCSAHPAVHFCFLLQSQVEHLLEEEEEAAADQLHLQALLDVAVEQLQQLGDVRER